MPIPARGRSTPGPLALAILLTCVAACDPPPPIDPPAQVLTVPWFRADDPRIGTAGFVSQTTRIDRAVDGTTYTLMIFAVGERVTLGAMVNGDFDGVATWLVGDRAFDVPLSRSNRGRRDVSVTARVPDSLRLTGEHGGFGAFDWVNVDVPLDEWLEDGTRVRLEFRADGLHVPLPSEHGWFVSALAER